MNQCLIRLDESLTEIAGLDGLSLFTMRRRLLFPSASRM
jgi:hypothetical protein